MLAIGAASAAAILLAWYAYFARYNRGRGLQALAWIQEAFASHGQLLAVRWFGPAEFQVRLRFSPALFREAYVLVRLHPRHIPILWMVARITRRPETLTFEANLDLPPMFNLEVHNHRWCGRTRRRPPDRQTLTLEHVGPFVLTSRTEWQREITSMMTALLASRDCDFLSVAFHRSSPHLNATVVLQSISPESQRSSDICEVLRELASCASASKF